MGRRATLTLLLWLLPLDAADNQYLSAQRKFDEIESEKLPAGSRVFVTSSELNAWSRVEAQTVVKQGLRNPRIDLGSGTASGSALVDFLKLKEAGGSRPSRLMAWLLEGERPVQVTVRITSKTGAATVDMERVGVAGVTIRGSALDFLISSFLLPYYPEAKIGEPFELGHRIDRLEIHPSGVSVVIGNRPTH
jgi:hypothetical protein